MNKAATRSGLVLAPAMLALGFAGCGDKTDVSAPVDQLNASLAATRVKLDCPKEVDGGAGTKFDCKVTGGKGGEQTVQLKVIKQGGDLKVDANSQTEFQSVLKKAVGG